MVESEFLTLKEAAAVFSVHVNTMRRAIRLGYIVGIRIGNGSKSPYRISKVSIEGIHQAIVAQHLAKATRQESISNS